MDCSIKFKNTGKIYSLEARQDLTISLNSAWEFFSNPKNLVKIMPDNLGFENLSDLNETIYPSQIIKYKVKPLPFFKTIWVTQITNVEPPHFFADKQLNGPYELWYHKHFFKETEGGVQVIDIVDYALPYGILGRIINPIVIKPRLVKIFEFRKKKLKELFF